MPAFWYRLSLRSRLFASFISVITAVLVFSLVLQSRFHMQARLQSLVEEELPVHLSHLADQVTLRLLPSLEASRALAANTFIERWIESGMPAKDLEAIEAQMARTAEKTGVQVVFIAAAAATHQVYYQYQQGQLKQRPLASDSGQDDWYFRFINKNQPHELNLNIDVFTGDRLQLFINYRSPQALNDQQPLSVAGVSLEVSDLAEMITQYRLGETGYAALVTADGSIQVAAEGAAIHAWAAQPVFQALLQQDAGILTLTHAGQTLLVGSIWMEELQRFLFVEVPRSEWMESIERQLYTALLIGALLIFLSLALIYPLAMSLSQPLKAFQDQLQGIAQTLDLSQRLKEPKDAELGRLARETNGLLKRLDEMIQAVAQSAGRLTEAARHLASTAGLVARHSGQQEAAYQSMAAAVEEMSSSVAEITSTMEELSASSTQIADHSRSVVDLANLTLDKSQTGVEAMGQLQTRMDGIHQDNQHNLQEILSLGAQSKHISRVMDLINDLADQTKLIAFNAALEASSAGEAGKRFSVVASEIRRLADRVTDSTQDIEARIQTTQDTIRRLVITSEQGAVSIRAALELSQTTSEDLHALLQAASQTSRAAEQISLSTQQQKVASSQVVLALHDIASASAHNAQSVRQISDISEDLLALSEHLNQLTEAFGRDLH